LEQRYHLLAPLGLGVLLCGTLDFLLTDIDICELVHLRINTKLLSILRTGVLCNRYANHSNQRSSCLRHLACRKLRYTCMFVVNSNYVNPNKVFEWHYVYGKCITNTSAPHSAPDGIDLTAGALQDFIESKSLVSNMCTFLRVVSLNFLIIVLRQRAINRPTSSCTIPAEDVRQSASSVTLRNKTLRCMNNGLLFLLLDVGCYSACNYYVGRGWTGAVSAW